MSNDEVRGSLEIRRSYWILEIEIISALPGGVYIVEVRTEKGVEVKKFIKE